MRRKWTKARAIKAQTPPLHVTWDSRTSYTFTNYCPPSPTKQRKTSYKQGSSSALKKGITLVFKIPAWIGLSSLCPLCKSFWCHLSNYVSRLLILEYELQGIDPQYVISDEMYTLGAESFFEQTRQLMYKEPSK